jgi:hypothetical protein
MIVQRFRYWLLFLSALAGCVEPYMPREVPSAPDYLVVDGFVNASSRTATVKLSRAVALDHIGAPPPVSGATVSIEAENGDEYFLPGTMSPGRYEATDIPLSFESRYRLKVKIGAKLYESALVAVVRAAPIGEVEWRADEDFLKILVHTSESAESAKYFRWKYEETWEYTAPYFSGYYVLDGEAVLRTSEEEIYTCYRTDPSYQINIASSQNLVTNVIKNYELTKIERTDIRLSKLYSINVQQSGLSEEAYSYWLNLYKTTENMGGLFDPMPGQITGNMKSISDPSELVIGFFSISTVEEKRIFIRRDEMPQRYVLFKYPYCQVDTVFLEDVPALSTGTALMGGVYPEVGFPVIIGYTITERLCVDCVSFGKGTIAKPAFWPR